MILLQFISAQLLIDFGTQFIKTTTIKNRKPDIVLDHQSKRKILNCVAYTTNLWVGNDCQSYLTRKPTQVAMSSKLLLPLLNDEKDIVPFYNSLFPVPISNNNLIKLDTEYSVIDIFAILINQIQEYHDPIHKSKDIYLVLPYYYDYKLKYKIQQLSAILNTTITLLNENTMTMVQYAQSNQLAQYFESNKEADQIYMVFDMGHSTTMSLYKVKYHSTSAITSVNTMGLSIECLFQSHNEQGGFNIDLLIRNELVSAFLKKYPKSKDSINTNKRALMQLLVQAQRIKHVLSANSQVQIQIEQLHDDHDFKHIMTRTEFEALLMPIDIKSPINQLFSNSKIPISDISSVIVVGGTSRIPWIQDQLTALIGDKLSWQVDGTEGTAMGAAYYYMTQSPRFIMKPYNVSDIIHYDVYLNNTLIFPKSTRVGIKKYLSFVREADYTFTLYVNKDAAYTVTIGNVKWASSKVQNAIKSKTRVLIEINKSGLISVGGASYDAQIMPIEPEKVDAPLVEETVAETPSEADKTPKETPSPDATPTTAPKPMKLSYPLTVGIKYLMADLSDSDILESTTRLNNLWASEEARKNRELALNQLESQIYSIKNGLQDKIYKFLQTTEMEKLENENNLNYKWFEAHGFEATEAELTDKYNINKEMLVAHDFRESEHNLRDGFKNDLLETIDIVHRFIQDKRGEEDRDAYIKDEELEKLEKLNEEIRKWLTLKIEEQGKLGIAEDPVLLTSELETKNRKIMSSYVNLRKRPKPIKVKPTPEESEKEFEEEPVLESDKEDEEEKEEFRLRTFLDTGVRGIIDVRTKFDLPPKIEGEACEMEKRFSMLFKRKEQIIVQELNVVNPDLQQNRQMERSPSNSDNSELDKVSVDSGESLHYILSQYVHTIPIPLPSSHVDKRKKSLKRNSSTMTRYNYKYGNAGIKMIFEIPNSHSITICYEDCWMMKMKDFELSHQEFLSQPWLKFPTDELFLETLWNELKSASNFCIVLCFRTENELVDEYCYLDAYNHKEITKEVVERFKLLYTKIIYIEPVKLENLVYVKHKETIGAFESVVVVVRKDLDGALSNQCWIEHDNRFFLLLDDVDPSEMPFTEYEFFIGVSQALKNTMTLDDSFKLLSQLEIDKKFEKVSDKVVKML